MVVPNLLKGSNQFASCQETYNIGIVNTNTIQKITVGGLLGFTRAQAIARQYQLYRIARIELQLKPLYDTYIPGAASAAPLTVPQLYYSIIRDGDFPTVGTNVYFERRGCKPIRFDDKIQKLSWKPNALMEVSGGAFASNNGQVKMTPWLSCDATQGVAWSPNETPHYGMALAAFTTLANPAVQVPVMDVTMTVHFQFKKAHQQLETTGVPVVDQTPQGYIEYFDASGNSLDGRTHT